ncbi:hypothetical protein FJ546_27340 [Mesorhizobium sp. B2-4-19]|uniref:hypothetical protein n=1 Tax=Mesorhizobium sp. B2-4-19 TaxID=2589930 RepID=UPI00112AEB81|nr:hypothetical protein [Mesorhizobium sp. B2-4-19]TPK57343.1 hypothetical protein FJ546_27340 [Mesorhizobium sp. B2-4-19]
MADVEIGGIFRRNYIREPVLLPDSERMRRRFFMMFMDGGDLQRHEFAELMERVLGVDYPTRLGDYQHRKFWMEYDIADVLSALTYWYRMNDESMLIRREVQVIFKEEQVRYRVDDKCGVHFFVDEEFEHAVQASIAGLADPQYKSALHAFQSAIANLGVANQSGKRLIRDIFEAVESAFLTVIKQPKIDRVSDTAIDTYFRPILLQRYASWVDAGVISDRVLNVFKAWVKVGHYYRHGSPLDQIHEPPLDFAIAVASEGMAILRYIVSK